MSASPSAFGAVQRDASSALTDEAQLDHDARTKLTTIEGRLHTLQAAYEANLRNATWASRPLVSDEGALGGLSRDDLDEAQDAALERGVAGALLPVLAPAYSDAMARLQDRALRKRLFEARFTRASDRGPLAGQWDNAPLVMETLELRHARAQLLGFRNHAEFALRHSVYPDPDDAERYLLDTHRETKTKAQLELDALWAFAKEKGVPRGFSHWDLPYYARWSAQDELNHDAAEASAYFPLQAVLSGLSHLAQRLLGVRLTGLPPADPRGLPPIHGFAVQAADGAELGRLVVTTDPATDQVADLPLERSLGAEPELRVRLGAGGQHPLLDIDAVFALARAFGRGLALLGLRDDPQHSSKRRHDHALSAWVCAAYFEQSCAAPELLAQLSSHHESGQPAPHALLAKLLSAHARHTHLRASMALEMALFDLRIHRDYIPADRGTHLRDQILDTLMQVRREQSVLPLPYWTRVANACPALFVEDEAVHLWEHTWADHQAVELVRMARREGFSDAALARIHQQLWCADGNTALPRRIAALQGLPLAPTG